MSRTSSLNSPDIGERSRRLTAERLAALQAACDCPAVIDEKTGRAIKQHVHPCQHLVDYSCGMRITPQRAPEDDWAAAKQRTQALVPAFIGPAPGSPAPQSNVVRAVVAAWTTLR